MHEPGIPTGSGGLFCGGERAGSGLAGAVSGAGLRGGCAFARGGGGTAAGACRRREVFRAGPGGGEFPGPGCTAAAAIKEANGEIHLDDFADEPIGSRIGRYKLLQKIGEGGCGVVYLAEQEEPVRRRVALKVIKLGMDTKSVIARFEAERQALAMMDHPNIAQGARCRRDGNRPAVFRDGTGARHQDHRLLRPEQSRHARSGWSCSSRSARPSSTRIKRASFIATSSRRTFWSRMHDGVPVPKVIDFGIAKATEGRLTDKTLFTAFEQFIGTPAYMSPEQAEMSGLDIDTRSDIYASACCFTNC